MSAYKEETEMWVDKALALAVITLPIGIALMPVPEVDLESVALTIFAALAVLAMLFVLRSGWLANALMTKGKFKFTLFVAASAVMGALLGTHAWLPSALAWGLLGAGAWLALLLCLVVGRLISLVVLWPVLWLARHFSFESAPTHCGSYASPAPRRYSAPADSSAGYAAAAGAATGYAAGQVWGDMSDPLDPMNPLNPLSPAAQQHAQMLEQMQEPTRMFPLVNPTNGIPMSSDGGVDDFGHAYGDPAPVFETPSYDYSNNSCGGCNTGGGFDF